MNANNNGQFGEYAVAAELCRRGWIATTFTRNMPGFDILAFNSETKKLVRIQVKTVASGEWSLDAKKFLKLNPEKFKRGVQEIEGTTDVDEADYVVLVKVTKGWPQFYVLTNKQLQKIIARNYSVYLKAKKGIRPKNPLTTHTALGPQDVTRFENGWEYLR